MFIKAEKNLQNLSPIHAKNSQKKNRNIQDIPQFDKGCQ